MNNQEKLEITKEGKQEMTEIYFIKSLFFNKDGQIEYKYIPYNPRIFYTAYSN